MKLPKTISLRAVLALVTVVAALTAYGTKVYRDTLHQQAVAAQLQAMGVFLSYGDQMRDDGSYIDAGSAPPRQDWRLRFLPRDAVFSIVGASATPLGDGPVRDQKLRALAQIKSLRSLDLRFSQLTPKGISALRDFSDLRYLDLGDTEMTVGTLVQLSECSLTSLNLANVSLWPGEVRQLSKMKSLRRLNVSRSRGGNVTTVSPVMDERLLELGELTQLTELRLAGAEITDQGLKNLASLESLEVLDIARTPIGDDGARVVMQLPKLRSLRLGGTKVSAATISALAALPELRRLDLSEFPFAANAKPHGVIDSQNVDCLSELDHLIELELAETNIGDESVAILGKLQHLRLLNVRGTAISKEGIDRLRKALPETRIEDDFQQRAPYF